ncbi:hypothetical protein [uncultured Paraglaciecola sp.]|jgi:hypothetical protein|uniref:hypothetical protein n=1 Tax=uncultured Paraglaciecola sp. TaxID=1765024 RepID=UPI0025FA7054|nr:hypothetical protein [uncultured Paraglaciecola sp.]
MKAIALNSIAILGGLVLGSAVNMGLISIGSELIPPPEGVDVSSMEGLANAMQLFETKHFLFPFLAHSFGTLAGAIFATKVATTHKLKIALLIGVAFFAGGTTMVFNLPSPLWFNALDLIVAYMPMAYLGHKLVKK